MLYRLEKKFGKFAIKNLMVYVTAMYVLGWLIAVISPGFYVNWLVLDVSKVLKGEVWRLVTFLIQPVEAASDGMGMLFMLISLYLYYFIGRTLESLWGSFRFNLFYFSGIVFNILAVFIVYFATLSVIGVGYSMWITLDYINLSLFLAFAVEFSEVSLLLFFIIPIKVKYIGIVYAGFHVINIVTLLFSGDVIGIYQAIALTVAILNFIIFFFSTRKMRKGAVKNVKRRIRYTTEVRRGEREAQQASVNAEGRSVVSRHRCVVCGRTELDDPDLEFRFCSRCEGEFEYCMDHLYTHVHVVREKKVDTNDTKEE